MLRKILYVALITVAIFLGSTRAVKASTQCVSNGTNPDEPCKQGEYCGDTVAGSYCQSCLYLTEQEAASHPKCSKTDYTPGWPAGTDTSVCDKDEKCSTGQACILVTGNKTKCESCSSFTAEVKALHSSCTTPVGGVPDSCLTNGADDNTKCTEIGNICYDGKCTYTISGANVCIPGSSNAYFACPVGTTCTPIPGKASAGICADDKATCNASSDCSASLPYCDPNLKKCLPLSSGVGSVSNDQCETAASAFQSGLGSFVKDNILWGAGFFVADTITSLLENLSIFGFQIGGIFEPIDQTIDFLRTQWLNALVWGIIATLGNWIAGSLVSAGIALNNNIIANNDLVKYGFGIILGLANIGLVIGLVWIGIATILRIKNYSMQGTLGRLLIAAVLINFTLGIAGVILKLGNDVTEAMYKAANPCPGPMTSQFSVPTIYKSLKEFTGAVSDSKPTGQTYDQGSAESTSNDPNSGGQGGLMASLENIISNLALDYISLIGASVLSSIGALTFLVLGVFLLIRYVIIMLLLVFSPAIWIGFVFNKLKVPGIGTLWDGWWEQFLKWVFFGPIIVFFIALTSVFLSSTLKSKPTSYLEGMPNSQAYAADGATFQGAIYKIAQLIAALIISAGGIYAANKFSGVAGNLVMAGVNKGVGALTGGMQKLGKSALRGSARLGESDSRFARGVGSALGGLSTPLQKGAPAFSGQLKTAGIKMQPNKVLSTQELRTEDMKTAEEKIKGMNSDELAAELQRIETSNIGKEDTPIVRRHRAERVAILKKLADSGDLNKVQNLKFKDISAANRNVSAMDRVLSESTKKDFEFLGQKFGDIEKGVGMPAGAYAAIKVMGSSTATVAEKAAAKVTAETEIKKFYNSLSPKDIQKIPANEIYGKYDAAKPAFGLNQTEFEELQRINTKGLLANPGDINKVASSIKSKNYDQFMSSILTEAFTSGEAKKITSHQNDLTTLINDASVKRARLATVNTALATNPTDAALLAEKSSLNTWIAALPGQMSAKRTQIAALRASTHVADVANLKNLAPADRAIEIERLARELKTVDQNTSKAILKNLMQRTTGSNPSPNPTP